MSIFFSSVNCATSNSLPHRKCWQYIEHENVLTSDVLCAIHSGRMARLFMCEDNKEHSCTLGLLLVLALQCSLRQT